MYTLNPNYNLKNEHNHHLFIAYFYYISDDWKHDILFV
jgi:hypothetical protein